MKSQSRHIRRFEKPYLFATLPNPSLKQCYLLDLLSANLHGRRWCLFLCLTLIQTIPKNRYNFQIEKNNLQAFHLICSSQNEMVTMPKKIVADNVIMSLKC